MPAYRVVRGVDVGDARIDALAAESEAGVRRQEAVAEALAILAIENRAALSRENRPEGQVLVGAEHEEIGDAEAIAVRGIMAEDRRQEAAGTLHRRIGMREIGRPEDRDALDLHDRVVILDDLQFLIVDRVLGLDLPDRWRGRIGGAELAG